MKVLSTIPIIRIIGKVVIFNGRIKILMADISDVEHIGRNRKQIFNVYLNNLGDYPDIRFVAS